VVLHKFPVLDQRRILGELLCNVGMAAEELAGLSVRTVAVSIAIAAELAIVLAAVVTSFLLHEGVRIFLRLFPNTRVFLQISLQRWMVLHEFVVIHQRRILANLLGDFAVLIEELIKICQFPARRTAIPIEIRILIAYGILVAVPSNIVYMPLVESFPLHEGVRICLYFLLNSRMIL